MQQQETARTSNFSRNHYCLQEVGLTRQQILAHFREVRVRSGLDQLLRWLTGMFEYWDDPDCMFRARRTCCRSSLGRFGEFWEDLCTWALMWAYNRVSLEGRRLFELEQTQVWMTVEDFLCLYRADRPGGAA
ncbi:MAG: hypothetical protein ACP5JJ_03825 [Anaerolineae bacterium]